MLPFHLSVLPMTSVASRTHTCMHVMHVMAIWVHDVPKAPLLVGLPWSPKHKLKLPSMNPWTGCHCLQSSLIFGILNSLCPLGDSILMHIKTKVVILMCQSTQSDDAWMWFKLKGLHLISITFWIFVRLSIMNCTIPVNIVKYNLEQTRLEKIKH